MFVWPDQFMHQLLSDVLINLAKYYPMDYLLLIKYFMACFVQDYNGVGPMYSDAICKLFQ